LIALVAVACLKSQQMKLQRNRCSKYSSKRWW